jgi:hypothetical protein
MPSSSLPQRRALCTAYRRPWYGPSQRYGSPRIPHYAMSPSTSLWGSRTTLQQRRALCTAYRRPWYGASLHCAHVLLAPSVAWEVVLFE